MRIALVVSRYHAFVTEPLEAGAREQLRFGGMMFAGFLAAAIVLGWLMYPFPL